jgi:predicted DNA-binding protein (UPF0251 family)
MVAAMPDATYFKPAGIPLLYLNEIRLSVEEAEALRLKDLEGLEQAEGAVSMGVSRPTFQRILSSARKKVADALLNGKAIKIEGGHFQIDARRLCCCKHHDSGTAVEPDDKKSSCRPLCREEEQESAASAPEAGDSAAEGLSES